jgi:DNA-binding PadR family transcriptional regulator
MASRDGAGRQLTDFEQVLLGVVRSEPRSGYGLKKMFNASPASVYQPSPGALYPALRRLEARGLLRAELTESAGRREQRLYQATEAGRAVHEEWLRQPVDPATVGADLGLHLMRFALMENYLPREAVLDFLKDLAGALEAFVTAMERYVASGVQSGKPHAELAIKHGIAVHRASLDWTRAALAELGQSKLFLRPSRT